MMSLLLFPGEARVTRSEPTPDVIRTDGQPALCSYLFISFCFCQGQLFFPRNAANLCIRTSGWVALL